MTGRAAIVAAIVQLALPLVTLGAWGGDAGGNFWRPDEGLAAYQRRDYAAAIRVWLPLAQGDDARAQTWIGMLHLRGEGVPKDHAQAAGWFAKAAVRGYGEAEYRLGVMYEFGHGFAQDKPLAARYYETAANHGHAKAQLRLSEMHYFGVGVPLDPVRAYMWASVALQFATGEHERLSAEGARDTMAELLPAAKISEAQRRVREWMAAFGRGK